MAGAHASSFQLARALPRPLLTRACRGSRRLFPGVCAQPTVEK
jgi:hypothetical protein